MGGHDRGNTVGWIMTESILYGGCDKRYDRGDSVTDHWLGSIIAVYTFSKGKSFHSLLRCIWDRTSANKASTRTHFSTTPMTTWIFYRSRRLQKKRRAQTEETCWNQMIYLPTTTPTHGDLKNTPTPSSSGRKRGHLPGSIELAGQKKEKKKRESERDSFTSERTLRHFKFVITWCIKNLANSVFSEVSIFGYMFD